MTVKGVKPAAQSADAVRELTYELLLTLLEHQLSSPVQWIITQASLCEARQPGQRYVEIGPSNTLQAMLKQTLAKSQDRDGQDIDNLTFADELERIKNPTDVEPEETAEDVADVVVAPEPSKSVQQPTQSAVTAPAPRPRQSVAQADAPPTAAEAVFAIVASGLRVPRSSVDTAQSVRFLAKGRSALQNEIIGSLDAEFGQLPDDVENLTLVDLGEKLQPTFSGKLGKFLNEWLAKRVSAKLAPSITVSKIRAHLKKTYGLQTGRQNSFFLNAEFDEIAIRLKDDQESWQAVDKWAGAYVQERGLALVGDVGDVQDGASGAASQEAMIGKSILTNFSRDLTGLLERHFGLQDGANGAEASATQPQADAAIALAMSHLEEELGPEFIKGTRPIFKPELVYRYQSGWNWAVQDLYVALSEIIAKSEKKDDQEEPSVEEYIEKTCEKVRDRSTERVRRCAIYLLNKWEGSTASSAKELCIQFLHKLLQGEKTTASLDDESRPTRRTVPSTTVTPEGDVIYREVPVAEANLAQHGSESSRDYLNVHALDSSEDTVSSISITELQPVRLLTKATGSVSWTTNVELTADLHRAERRLVTDGDAGLYGTTLIIGAGKQSIGFVLVRRLLEAGCRVCLCTNRPTAAARKDVAELFAQAARPGAELVLLPFNQASIQDVDNMVGYINDTLGWEIDHLVPFAAIPEAGRTLEDLGSISELAHRVMLTNTLRLMGSIATSKQRREVLYHMTQVLVPLSPNHGQFSHDGLYAESKLGLEALMNKWGAEPWSAQLSMCGVRIGWTRGTGLMVSNDLLAEEVEKLGIRTFSGDEMATLLTLAMSPDIVEACSLQPVLCDFSGGFQSNPKVGSEAIDSIRASIQTASAVRKRLKEEKELDAPTQEKPKKGSAASVPREKRAGLAKVFPELPERRQDFIERDLQGLLDLDSVVVITGFGELGPAGTSRTRWELESKGDFSLEGCVELAWMTGLIRYERSRVQGGQDSGPGWVECETGAAIREMDVKAKFEARIRERTGIRILDQGDSANSDPRLRNMLHEVGMQEDLPPFECSPEAAEALRARHGDAVEILSNDGSTATARIRRGASIFVPKAINTDFFVGAQMPSGWDPARYGIPADVLAQADRPALYTLVCAVEAFLSAGLTDVYELYKYIHVSEVGNCVGSGAGGSTAIQLFHEQRLMGKEVRNDILSEAFIGTAAAWINLLLLSASGPIKTGAGTCATSLESLDTACELITSGRTKMCLAGGYDVFTHPVYYEFGAMGAIANASGDARAGREPQEMSRPFTSTRGGFTLGEGVGIQVLSSAALALEMGLPIYGVVGMTHLAGDKLGRSVPAPGQGMLTAAKQNPSAPIPSMLLNPTLRAKRIRTSIAHIESQAAEDEAVTRTEAEAAGCSSEEVEWRVQSVREAARLEKKAVLQALGQRFFVGHPGISPITGALSVYGLSIDDITFASLHGTATKLNDTNECSTLDRQMRHLGRNPGNPLFTIAQKSVVGHGLGASGAWAVNGALQAMHSGIIPGNRNADDIDKALESFDTLLLTNKNITVRPEDMKTFSVTSFGFGQKGAQVLVLHPRYLYAAISNEEYEVYRIKQMARGPKVSRELDRGLHGQPLFKAKSDTPYAGHHDFLLNPLARLPRLSHD